LALDYEAFDQDLTLGAWRDVALYRVSRATPRG